MEKNNNLFKNLSLNLFLIPEKPLLERQEKWDETVNSSIKFGRIVFSRTTHLYYSTVLKDILIEKIKQIENTGNLENVKLIHETSYSGLPYQIYAETKYQDNKIKVFFDGLIFFINEDKQNDIDSLENLIKATDAAGDFENFCYNLVDLFGLKVYLLYSSFWDVEITNIAGLGLSTESEYPAFKVICNDSRYQTITNLGDKQVGSIGKNYYLYFSENKKFIRDRICQEIIVSYDINLFYQYIKSKNDFLVNANSSLLMSLKNIPGSFFTFSKRNRKWKKLKNIPESILTIDSYLLKYKEFVDMLKKEITNRYSFINVPRTMWIAEEKPDEKILNQREIPNFFLLKYNGGKLSVKEETSIKPSYSHLSKTIDDEFTKLEQYTKTAITNLNNAISLYSTNFGFDALWIAIIALFVAIIPVKNIFLLLKKIITLLIKFC